MSLTHGLENTYIVGTFNSAPGAGSAFCSMAAPEAGTYRLSFNWILSGTTETAISNVRFRWNNANQVVGIASITGAGLLSAEVEFASLDGINAVQMTAAAAATGGAIYNGFITATKIG